MGCQSSSKNSEPNSPLKNVPANSSVDVSTLGIQLTKEGENRDPSLSPDGKSVLFVSEKRTAHTQAQIYLEDLENMVQRRITYQDGICSTPMFSADGKKIIYASDTDEKKEQLSIVKGSADNQVWPGAELYEQNISGTEIDRLTNSEGYDGAPSLGEAHATSIYFQHWNGDNMEIWQLNTATQGSFVFLKKKDKSIESYHYSKLEKKAAWIERDNEDKTIVMVDKKPVKLPSGEYKNLDWWRNKLVFSSNSLSKKFQLYSYNPKTDCMEKLFEHDSNLSSPQMHPFRDALVFVSDVSGKNQLYYKSINVATEPVCLNKAL